MILPQRNSSVNSLPTLLRSASSVLTRTLPCLQLKLRSKNLPKQVAFVSSKVIPQPNQTLTNFSLQQTLLVFLSNNNKNETFSSTTVFILFIFIFIYYLKIMIFIFIYILYFINN